MIEDIRGEYWIINGDVEFAGGDVGDKNHEMVATEYIYNWYKDQTVKLAKSVGLLVNLDDYDGVDMEEMQQVLTIIHNELMKPDTSLWVKGFRPMTEENANNYIIKQLKCDKDAYDVLTTGNGGYEYALEYLGWVAVRENNVEFYGWSRQKQDEIVRGLEYILDQEGIEGGDEEIEFSLYDGKTGRHWTSTLAELKQGPKLSTSKPTHGYKHKAFIQYLRDREENKYQQPTKSVIKPWNTAAQQAGIGSELWRGTSEGFREWLER
jgi:hypothetical protein